jgi:hypothetical protein
MTDRDVTDIMLVHAPIGIVSNLPRINEAHEFFREERTCAREACLNALVTAWVLAVIRLCRNQKLVNRVGKLEDDIFCVGPEPSFSILR